MAKALKLKVGGNLYELEPTKIERKKIYGWTEVRVTTPDGELCRQAGVDSNGCTIIPKGATKMGMLREDGNWMEKSELVAMHADGTPAESIASSFDGEIDLSTEATVEDLFDHVITSVYQLSGDDTAAMAAAIGSKIYTFPFSYRGGYETSTGFLLTQGEVPFIFVGDRAQFEFVGLEEQSIIDEPDDEVAMEDDELDFSMF